MFCCHTLLIKLVILASLKAGVAITGGLWEFGQSVFGFSNSMEGLPVYTPTIHSYQQVSFSLSLKS